MDLLEASARLHELGHLRVWGSNPSQIEDWGNSCLFGQYGKVLNKLLGKIDTDLIHACLALAFRADFFPFLDGSCSLETVQPVHRFSAMIGALTDWGVTQATGKNARSTDTRATFHDRVVEALVERFGRINDSDKFRQSDRALCAHFSTRTRNPHITLTNSLTYVHCIWRRAVWRISATLVLNLKPVSSFGYGASQPCCHST